MWGQIVNMAVNYGIGTGSNAASMEPMIVSSHVASVSIGTLDNPVAFYLLDDGTVYAFGSNSQSQVL
jgi:hypothetical protein